MSEDRELKEYIDIPRTMAGHTSFPKSFDFLLTKKGLDSILGQMEDGDYLRITLSSGGWKFEVVGKSGGT